MDINNIQALIAQGLITDVASIDPNNAYITIGVYQPGNRPAGSGNNTYPSYAIPVSEFLNGSSAITGAQNGLNLVGTIAELGGTLIHNTDIDIAGFSMLFKNGSYPILFLDPSKQQVAIGSNNPNAMLDITAVGSSTVGLNLNTSSTQDAKLHFRTNNSLTPRTQVYLENSTQTFNVYTVNNDTIFWNGNGLAQSKTLTLFTNTTAKFENNLGIGITASSNTRTHIQGTGSTSATYSLKVDNLAGNPLFYVRNDAIVTVGKTLEISRYGFNTTKAFWVEAEVTTENTLMSTHNADLVFKTRSSGAVETMRMTNAGKVIINNGSYLTLGVLDPSTDKYAYIDSAGNTTASAGLKFSVCHVGTTTGMTAMQIEAGGKVGVNISNPLLTFSVKPTSNLDGIILQEDASNFYCQIVKDGTRGLLALYDGGTPKVFFNSPTYSSGIDFINTGQNLGIGLNAASAKVHIYGDATSSNYALKVDNSAFNPLLYVRNDGVTTFNTASTYATNFAYNVKWQAFSNPTSSDGNYISLCTGGGSVFQTTFGRRNGSVVKTEMYFIESNDTTYMAIGVIGDANKALALRTNDLDRVFITHAGDVCIGGNTPTTKLQVIGLPTYADNASALVAGLTNGAMYIRTGHGLDIVI